MRLLRIVALETNWNLRFWSYSIYLPEPERRLQSSVSLQYGRQAHQATDKRGVAGTEHFRIQCQKERSYHRFYGSISFAKQPVQGQCQYRQTYSIGQQQGSTQRDTFRFGQLYYRPVFNSGYSPQNRDNQYPKQEKRLFAHCEESL